MSHPEEDQEVEDPEIQPEAQPLLGHGRKPLRKRGVTSLCLDEVLQERQDTTDKDFESEYEDVHVEDAMTYHTTFLKGWNVFCVLKNTIWAQQALWLMMARLLAMSVLVATATYFFLPDPNHINSAKFREITSVMNIFIGLMLSFFLAESVKRWCHCIDGFLGLFNSIRNLSMQFHALGAPPELSRRCVRYGVLSSVMLINDLKRMAMEDDGHSGQRSLDELWDRLIASARLDANRFCFATVEEKEMMRKVHDIPGLMWVWCGSIIGRMSQNGEVPPMFSPTYGRILDLCQQAQMNIKQVRCSMFVRTPFVYVHTLATLVHVTNGLFAIALGLTVGSSIEGIVEHAQSWWYETELDPTATLPAEKWQIIIIEVIKCTVAPTLYQAFFMLGCSVSCPFSDQDSAVPVNRMLRSLCNDLADADKLAVRPPSWDPPRFAKK
jgi:hypothetical protein